MGETVELGDTAERSTAAVRRALGILGGLRDDHAACPSGTDRFDWSADILDELARLVGEIVPTIAHVTGRDDDVLAARANDLTTAIVAHRNALMIPEPRAAGRHDGAA